MCITTFKDKTATNNEPNSKSFFVDCELGHESKSRPSHLIFFDCELGHESEYWPSHLFFVDCELGHESWLSH